MLSCARSDAGLIKCRAILHEAIGDDQDGRIALATLLAMAFLMRHLVGSEHAFLILCIPLSCKTS
jgi:hypothetical protein